MINETCSPLYVATSRASAVRPTRLLLTAAWLLALVPATSGAVPIVETEWVPRGLDLIRIAIRGTSATFRQARNGEGHPGRALVYEASVRAEPNATNTSAAVVLSNRLRHDPEIDGVIRAVSFSQSLYVDATDPASTFARVRFLMSWVDGGDRRVYAHEVPVAPLFGQWLTLTASDLRADDFSRVDLATGDLLADEHPTFGSNFTRFGVALGAGVVNLTERPIRERLEMRIDNLRVDVSAVPEPASAGMLLAGLLLMSAEIRRRCAQRDRG